MSDREPAEVAEKVRRACLEAAVEAYGSAGLSGLCEAGRWECAVDAIRGLDLRRVLRDGATEETS